MLWTFYIVNFIFFWVFHYWTYKGYHSILINCLGIFSFLIKTMEIKYLWSCMLHNLHFNSLMLKEEYDCSCIWHFTFKIGVTPKALCENYIQVHFSFGVFEQIFSRLMFKIDAFDSNKLLIWSISMTHLFSVL